MIINNIIKGNDSADGGGGIECHTSSAFIMNNVIIYDTSDLSGGGIYMVSASPTVIGNLIAGVVPVTWSSGEQHPFQALVGAELTNLLVMTVE